MQHQEIKVNLLDVIRERARRNVISFSKRIFPDNTWKEFHQVYYSVLNMFAHGQIKNLIITVPPQHGKSEGSTRILPSYMLGKNPNLKVAIGSYSSTFAKKFNREIQRIIDSEEYYSIFPETTLSSSNISSSSRGYLRNTEEFEIVDKKGGLKAVGRGGSLTGNPVDLMIMDDLYKDSMEGNSPPIREQVKDWYTSVVSKRLHNDSQQLIVFTRWHEEDLIGFIESTDTVIECTSYGQINRAINDDPNVWIKLNFQAIKESEPSEFDSREYGIALWEERHGIEKLKKEKEKNEHEFSCMNQGDPINKKGLLYKGFNTYSEIPEAVIKKGNYTDTADTGDDYLCSVCYDVANIDGELKIFVTDIVYNQSPMEDNEVNVPLMLDRMRTRKALIESNNGGRGFARNVGKSVKICEVEWFHQGKNKESRILTNCSQVCDHILFPIDWKERFPVFYNHVTKYKKKFSANKFDDAPDVLTGIYETEILDDWEPM